ncbi:hypothetical protein PIB30_005916 [Stylosanthes scabra]|uniref:DUF4283 domain-containing protein n=1 Tax=Stylosanthes scabra TaxID=79078 RepID=A0ABU6R4J5_9FABA|nr:hypothetical protein [Stylosanthes scabra]
MIDGVWAEDQRDTLGRSLLGCCVKPIEFRKVMNRVLDEWKGEGDIECRVVGPYRRVWIEIMGLPVCMWCKDNIERVARLWGKVLELDDRCGESKSFTTARVLIDCYQWEQVHEWVSIKIDDRVFKVFVKEVGMEMYSVEAHPNLGKSLSVSLDESVSYSHVDETLIGGGRPPVDSERQNLNLLNIIDPQLMTIINDSCLETVPPINGIRGY